MGCSASRDGGFDPYAYPEDPPTTLSPPKPAETANPPVASSENTAAGEATVPSSRNGKESVQTFTPSTRYLSVQPGQAKQPDGKFGDFYLAGKPLGYGAFATVFIGKHKNSKKEYAVKKIDRSKMFWGDRDALEDEISNLKDVRDGPHIIKLYEEYYEKNFCYLVMEYMQGGELFDRIIEKKTFTEAEARAVCRCMLKALDFMHSRRVVHRDLKPENLLLPTKNLDTDIKLADFGFAKKVRTHNGCRTLCGTPGYLAPEILERWPAYDTKCDIWSVGVILFLLLGGYLPFEDDDEDKVFDRTRNGLYEFHPDYFGRVSRDAKELVTILLTINPNKRASAQKALDHEWMQRGDQQLQNSVNFAKLRDSIMAKQKIKAAVKTLVAANRLKDLQVDFTTYLEKRRESHFSSIHPATAYNRPQSVLQQDDSETGKPFDQFYTTGDLLGEGGFAAVYRATHNRTKQVYAVKDVDVEKLEDHTLSTLQDEIAALRLLRGGPHIVRLHDVFKEEKHVYMVMEEMKGGELLQRIVDKKVYTEREARQTTKILFEAIDYCHKKRIAHRDIKPQNILLVDKDDDTSIKIADFGFAKKVTKRNCLSTLCGTAAYVAPEVLDLKSKGYDERADIWSIGVVVYILLGGYAPFEGPIEELAMTILEGDYEFHDEYWKHISKNAKDLVSSLLQVNPSLRLTAEEALQQDWMVAEEETLTFNDLSIAQSEIKKALPVEKLRGAVKAIIATKKLTSLGDSFKQILSTSQARRDLDGNVFDASITSFGQSLSSLDHRGIVIDGVVEEGSSSGKPFRELYDVGDELGSGSFSIVYSANHKVSRREYAVKFVPRRDLHPGDAVALQDEITALKTLKDCEYIVTLHDVFEEPDNLYIVLERMHGGDLIDRIIDKAHYTEADAKEVAKKLLVAISHCHDQRIANRNLKPENLLLVSRESDTDVKISDFGYAKKVLYPNSLRTQCGTEGYVAPEILSHKPAYDVSCDMWSLGVILYIVLGGYRPFRGSSDEVMKQIRYGEYEFHQKYWGHVSKEAKDLICRMLTVDQDDRITAKDALESTWITADDSKLGKTDLSANQDELKNFKGKAKLRQVVKMIIATNKFQSLGSNYRAFNGW